MHDIFILGVCYIVGAGTGACTPCAAGNYAADEGDWPYIFFFTLAEGKLLPNNDLGATF